MNDGAVTALIERLSWGIGEHPLVAGVSFGRDEYSPEPRWARICATLRETPLADMHEVYAALTTGDRQLNMGALATMVRQRSPMWRGPFPLFIDRCPQTGRWRVWFKWVHQPGLIV